MEENVQLPQEVLDTIMNNLHPRDDIQALRQCALTARCLVPAAQRILFREVCLTQRGHPEKQKSPDKFLDLLKHSPHLAMYTTGLCVLIRRGLCLCGDLSQHPLASIVPQLRSLQKVNINIFSSVSESDHPITLPRITTLLGGTAMPKIKSFSLDVRRVDIHEVFGICNWLAAHGDLQDLHFGGISISDSCTNSLLSQTVPSPVYLRRFTIITLPKFIDAFLPWATSSISPLRFNILRELTVGHLTSQSSIYLLHILDIAKDSLFCLRFMGDIPCLSSIQFNVFRNLRCIVCDLNSQTLLYCKAMLNEWRLVLKESGELKLEKFIISYRGNWTLGHDHPLNELEDALISGGRCACLELRILWTSTRIDTDTIRECFPLLHASDVCNLVVKNPLWASPPTEGGNFVCWEYTSRSGEWKNILFSNLFD